MQGEGHDISNEDFQSISPKESGKKQDTELDEQAALLGNTKELTTRNETQVETAVLDDIDSRRCQLLVFEVAWRLTQTILVGRVQQSLVGESLRDSLERFSAVDLDELALDFLERLLVVFGALGF